MKRTIKFRGRVPDTDKIYGGKIVCGSLLDYGESTSSCPQFWIRPKNSDINYPIDENSIAQLVGYDRNGEEIYEGDRVINPRDNTRFKAAMNHIYTVKIYEKEAKS